MLAAGGTEVEIYVVAVVVGDAQAAGAAVAAGTVVVVVQAAISGRIFKGDILQGIAGVALLKEPGDVVGVDLHSAAVIRIIADIAALCGHAGSPHIADGDGHGAVGLVAVLTVGSEVQLHHLAVGVPVRHKGQVIQGEVLVVEQVLAVVVEITVVQVALVKVRPVIIVVVAVQLAPVVQSVGVGEPYILQIVPGLVIQEIPEVVPVKGHAVVGIHLINDVALHLGAGAAALADLNGEGGGDLVAFHAAHGDVKGQGVFIGIPVRRKGQRVQLEVIVVPDIVLIIVKHGVVQVTVVQLVIPGVVVGIVSVGVETAVIVKVVIVGELHVFQFVVIRLVVEEIVEILRVQRHIVVRVHLIGQVALAAGAAALADLDVQSAIYLVTVHAVHGEVKGQGVRVGVPVGVERQRVQFKVIVVPDVVLVVIEHGIVQIAVIELIVRDIVIAVVSVCTEISEVIEIIVAGELHILQLIIAAVFLVKEIPEVLGVHRHIVAGVHLVGQLHVAGAGAGATLHINADRCIE